MNTLTLNDGLSRLLVLLFCLYCFPAIGGSFSTDFEFIDTSGSFSLGEEQDTVTFSNGEAKSIGVPVLYHSGSRSWMVDAQMTGTIDLSNPATSGVFFFRDQNEAVNSVIKIFDADDNEVKTLNGTTEWVEVDLAGLSAKRITLQNNGDNGYTVIDDFSAQTVVAAETNPIPQPVEMGSIRVRLKEVATGLTAPNWGVAAPNDNAKLYVSDQIGVLWQIDLASGEKNNFLDLTSRLVSLRSSFDERGFLGFAFAPDYQTSGLIYTYTSEPADGTHDFSTLPVDAQANHKSVVLEWEIANVGDTAFPVSPESVRPIMEIEQPQSNHNGGGLNFGPDGMLYIALGDGGSADDQGTGHSDIGNAQDNSNLLGALLRIDPVGNDAANGKYGIPADNPFIAQNDALNEIYAYGLRNPFRFSFDNNTGELYLADVGQNDIEEVDIVVSGGNYGWNKREGSFAFDANGDEPGFVTQTNTTDGTINPVAQYDHDEGVAIIGGFVYRGKTIPAIDGLYVFGDFRGPGTSVGRFFHSQGAQIEEFQLTESEKLNVNLLGFAQDAHGELYLLGNTTGRPFGETGVVYKIVSNSSFDGSLVNIPVVDVMQSGTLLDVYQAELRQISSSGAAQFELTQNIAILPREYKGDNASFDFSTGRLSLPYIDVKDEQGNITTYSAELQRIESAAGILFELVKAQLINRSENTL